MRTLKYKYNPNKKGVFRVSVVKNPAVGEGDLILMSAEDGPITTYADMLVKDENGKVLLLKRNPTCDFEPNKWGFPGGKVMPGETTKDGAIRECFEECGVSVDLESVNKVGEMLNDDNTTSHYFTAKPASEVKLGDEHQEFTWINSEDLKDYDLILNNKERFSDLIDGKVKMSEQKELKGIFYAPVMIPDLKITRIDENTKEKYLVYYDAETVEQLSNNYFKQCGNKGTNLEHEDEDFEGVYPVESWIVTDSENDKSKALGMPTQKVGTWVMGFKCESPEVLEKLKAKLLQGLSIEGQLDTEEDTENPITKFNKIIMSEEKKTPLQKAKHLWEVMMSAIGEEENSEEKTPEQIAAEEAKAKEDAEKMAAEEAAKTADAGEAATGGDDKDKEIETLKATIEEKDKQIADLTAELATYKNDATLMSAQLEEVEKKFTEYKSVKMSSQKLGDAPAEAVVLTPADAKQAKFLEDVRKKL